MVRLGKDSSHRAEHPFVLQKKANAALLSKTIIDKVAYINSGIASIPTPSTTLAQLEEHKETLARIFGACRAKKREVGKVLGAWDATPDTEFQDVGRCNIGICC